MYGLIGVAEAYAGGGRRQHTKAAAGRTGTDMIGFNDGYAVAGPGEFNGGDQASNTSPDDDGLTGCRKRCGCFVPAAFPPKRSRERQDLFLWRVELGFFACQLVDLDGPAGQR